MTNLVLLDAAGRRRSPATMPGFRCGRPPRNKGLRYPADPPTIEEIVAVMRVAGTTTHGLRTRALVVVLWRAGLRISEAGAGGERLGPLARQHPCPLRQGRQATPGRNGPMGMGTDRPVAPSQTVTAGRCAAACHRRPNGGTALVVGRCPRDTALARRPRRRPTALRATSTSTCARRRDGPRRRAAQRHPTPAGPRNLGITSVYLQGIDNREIGRRP
jgi:hypothetical protein